MDPLYNSVVYDHYRRPRHAGKIAKPTQVFNGQNISCGDQVKIFVRTDKQKKIVDVGWEGSGCAISQAATSLLSEMLIGNTVAQAKKIAAVALLKKLKTPLSPSRVKCATLPLYTIKEVEPE